MTTDPIACLEWTYELGIYGLIGQKVYIWGMYVCHWMLTLASNPQTFVCRFVYSIQFWIQPMVRWSSRVVVFVPMVVRSLDGDCSFCLPLCSLKGIFKVWWHFKIGLFCECNIIFTDFTSVFYKRCIENGCRTFSFVIVQHE